jgi:hypothetical protein
MTPLEKIGQLAIDYATSNASNCQASYFALQVAINTYKQSPPVENEANDLSEILKTADAILEGETLTRELANVHTLIHLAFRAGQSDNADTARLDFVFNSNGWSIIKCSQLEVDIAYESLNDRSEIDTSIAQTQNTQGGKAL